MALQAIVIYKFLESASSGRGWRWWRRWWRRRRGGGAAERTVEQLSMIVPPWNQEIYGFKIYAHFILYKYYFWLGYFLKDFPKDFAPLMQTAKLVTDAIFRKTTSSCKIKH